MASIGSTVLTAKIFDWTWSAVEYRLSLSRTHIISIRQKASARHENNPKAKASEKRQYWYCMRQPTAAHSGCLPFIDLPISKLPLGLPVLSSWSAYLVLWILQCGVDYQVLELLDMVGPRIAELPVRRKKDRSDGHSGRDNVALSQG